jgi:hypothetical protein
MHWLEILESTQNFKCMLCDLIYSVGIDGHLFQIPVVTAMNIEITVVWDVARVNTWVTSLVNLSVYE